MRIAATIDGADALASSARQAASELADTAAVNARVGGLILLELEPPVLTGAFANTLRARVTGDGVEITAGSSAVTYAGPILRRRPNFAERAADRIQDRIADAYTDHVKTALDSIKGA